MRKIPLKIGIFIGVVLILLQFQNCGSAGPINFFGENRQSLSSNATGGGESYDGKPSNGTYCRVFDNLSCQSNVNNLQSLLTVDDGGIEVTQDNCATTSTNFEFTDVAVAHTRLAPDYIGVTRGIFKKCEVAAPTEMAEAFCTSTQSNVAVVINKNLANQSLSVNLTFANSSGQRSVNGSVNQSQNAGGSIYSSSTQHFDLSIPNSISQTSQGHLVAIVDNTAMDITLECRQANPTPTIVIDRDMELSPTWIDVTRLAGYWKLNEVNAGDTTTIVDSSSFGYHGTLMTGDGNIKSDTTVDGGALRFDSINDFVEFPPSGHNHLNFGTGSFSYMLWMNKSGNAGSWDTPLWKGGNSATTIGYDFECGNSYCNAHISDGTRIIQVSLTPSADSFFNTWVHVVAVVDRNLNQLRTYVNGGLFSTASISGLGSLSTGSQLRIANGQGSFFFGSIDDVAVFNGALSGAEIQEIYQRLRPKFQ